MLSKLCKLSAENIEDISSKTIEQAENIKWCLYRNFRLTSNYFHKIIHASKINRYPNSLFKTLLGKCVLEGVKSIDSLLIVYDAPTKPFVFNVKGHNVITAVVLVQMRDHLLTIE